MIAVVVSQYNNKFLEFGVEVHEEDTCPDWEQDAAKLFNDNGVYTLLESHGCSCWSGEWEGWTDLTLEEVKILGVSWSKNSYGAAQLLGEWIMENL